MLRKGLPDECCASDKIAKKRAEAGSDTPAATSTTSATEPENKPAVRERDPVLLQELEVAFAAAISIQNHQSL